MAQAVNQSFSTDRRHDGTDPIAPNEHDERSEQGLRRELGRSDERDEQGRRDERAQRWQRDESDLPREPRRRSGDTRRTMMDESDGDRRDRSTDWTMPAMPNTTGDVLGPVLAAWGQAYASMFELAGDMMKLQQQTFASMIGAANTNAERMAVGDQRGRVVEGVSASRTSSADSGHIEHDRR
jgi:hypothetical protein